MIYWLNPIIRLCKYLYQNQIQDYISTLILYIMLCFWLSCNFKARSQCYNTKLYNFVNLNSIDRLIENYFRTMQQP